MARSLSRPGAAGALGHRITIPRVPAAAGRATPASPPPVTALAEPSPSYLHPATRPPSGYPRLQVTLILRKPAANVPYGFPN